MYHKLDLYYVYLAKRLLAPTWRKETWNREPWPKVRFMCMTSDTQFFPVRLKSRCKSGKQGGGKGIVLCHVSIHAGKCWKYIGSIWFLSSDATQVMMRPNIHVYVCIFVFWWWKTVNNDWAMMRKHENHVYISIYTWVEKHHIGILPSDKICAILCNSHWLVTNMPKDCNEIKHKYIISQKKERPLVRRNERWNNCTLNFKKHTLQAWRC